MIVQIITELIAAVAVITLIVMTLGSVVLPMTLGLFQRRP